MIADYGIIHGNFARWYRIRVLTTKEYLQIDNVMLRAGQTDSRVLTHAMLMPNAYTSVFTDLEAPHHTSGLFKYTLASRFLSAVVV